MSLNLITDQWIPVIRDNCRVNIRPSQICEKGVTKLCWPRPDFNLACLEFLVGLVFLADPVRDERDWNNRYQEPDLNRLDKALEPYSKYFELLGEGPRFLQDQEQFEVSINSSSKKPTDMLFIDSAGQQTKKHNSDLMVHRDRYGDLPLPFAAMALYTLQAFAPAGGSGNRTSMRGGGPMVTILQPIEENEYSLWRTVFLNVPNGEPLPPNQAHKALPWLRPTRTSEKNQKVTPESSHKVEMFFGMPRRLRLIEKDLKVVGWFQKPYGTNYENWKHYLTPYYRKDPGSDILPVHPKPGKVSYKNWLGVTMQQETNKNQLVAGTVHRYHNSSNPQSKVGVIVGGWAMKNMTPLDFNVHICPTFGLNNEGAENRISNLIKSASQAVSSLAGALSKTMKIKGGMNDKIKDEFYSKTENSFINIVSSLVVDNDNKTLHEEEWLKILRTITVRMFDDFTRSSMAELPLKSIKAIIEQRNILISNFTKPNKIQKTLGLEKRQKETR